MLWLIPWSASSALQPGVARVQGWLQSRADVTTLPPEALAPAFRYRGPLRGSSSLCRDEYCAASGRWHADCERLLEGYSTSVTRCAVLGSESRVGVNWEAEWRPPTSEWLAGLAGLLWWRVTRAPLDPETVKTFSWRGVGRLLWQAARTGQIQLPSALVQGRCILTLDNGLSEEENGGGRRVILAEETISAVELASVSRLRNRRVAQDVAEWLDVARRPDGETPDDWENLVRQAVLFGVPGAGPLDLDPSEDPTDGVFAFGAVALVSAALFGVATSAILGPAIYDAAYAIPY
jgi:hypothetical protein